MLCRILLFFYFLVKQLFNAAENSVCFDLNSLIDVEPYKHTLTPEGFPLYTCAWAKGVDGWKRRQSCTLNIPPWMNSLSLIKRSIKRSFLLGRQELKTSSWMKDNRDLFCFNSPRSKNQKKKKLIFTFETNAFSFLFFLFFFVFRSQWFCERSKGCADLYWRKLAKYCDWIDNKFRYKFNQCQR